MRYSEEFKNDAVALVRAGASQREVCRDLGVSKSAISKWLGDADRREQGLPAAKNVSPAEDARIRELEDAQARSKEPDERSGH